MTAILCPHCSGTVELPGQQRHPLTKRQRELLNYIQAFNAEHGYSPTYDEMRLNFKCAVGSIAGLVQELRKRGWVRTSHNRGRSIQVIEDAA